MTHFEVRESKAAHWEWAMQPMPILMFASPHPSGRFCNKGAVESTQDDVKVSRAWMPVANFLKVIVFRMNKVDVAQARFDSG